MRLMIIAALIALLFAAMNPQVVTVRFLLWHFDSPLVLIIVGTFAVGAFVGVVQLIPGFWRHRSKAKKHSKALSEVEKERDSLKEQVAALENKIQERSSSEDSYN